MSPFIVIVCTNVPHKKYVTKIQNNLQQQLQFIFISKMFTLPVDISKESNVDIKLLNKLAITTRANLGR